MDGKHEMKRDPAAITSLSAACRCASRPPSDPSDKSPRNWNPVRNDRVLLHLGLFILRLNSQDSLSRAKQLSSILAGYRLPAH